MTFEQYSAWLDHTGYSPDDFPLEMALRTIERRDSNYTDRRSLETFIAGWKAAESARLEKPITEQMLSGIFKRSKT